MEGLPRLTVQRATGAEPFTRNGEPVGFDLLSFWQWSSSDLVVNIMRGLLAEYLVGQALGIAGDVRDPWQPYDLRTPRGLALEVKSCSYLQSWWQKAHSDLTFSIAETTAWDPDTNKFLGEKRRQAHAYVFAVLAHRDKNTLNPRELTQWEFYLMPTRVITETCGARKSLSIKALLRLNPRRADYQGLQAAVAELEDELLGAPS
jgi:hypothetical protein